MVGLTVKDTKYGFIQIATKLKRKIVFPIPNNFDLLPNGLLDVSEQTLSNAEFLAKMPQRDGNDRVKLLWVENYS